MMSIIIIMASTAAAEQRTVRSVVTDEGRDIWQCVRSTAHIKYSSNVVQSSSRKRAAVCHRKNEMRSIMRHK